jgi:hypothetical protein
MSGGESWITGSPRSSARHIRPRSKSRGESVEEARAAQIAGDQQLEQLRQRGSKPLLVLADMLDDPFPLHDLDVLQRDRCHQGWPPKVIPCVYIDLPVRNGSATRSVAITPPMAA